jgi:hypothetical protein
MPDKHDEPQLPLGLLGSCVGSLVVASTGAVVFAPVPVLGYLAYKWVRGGEGRRVEKLRQKQDNLLYERKKRDEADARRRQLEDEERAHQRRLEANVVGKANRPKAEPSKEEIFSEAHRRYLANCQRILESELEPTAKEGMLRDERLKLQTRLTDALE